MINFNIVVDMWDKYLNEVAYSLFRDNKYANMDDVYDSSEWMNCVASDLSKMGIDENDLDNLTYYMAVEEPFSGDMLYKITAFLLYRLHSFKNMEDLNITVSDYSNFDINDLSKQDLALLLNCANKYLE